MTPSTRGGRGGRIREIDDLERTLRTDRVVDGVRGYNGKRASAVVKRVAEPRIAKLSGTAGVVCQDAHCRRAGGIAEVHNLQSLVI